MPSTGNLVSTVLTSTLADPTGYVPARQIKIFLISTGVNQLSFPTGLRTRIVGASSDLLDTSGYGTWAASVLFQLLANVQITSRNVGTNTIDVSRLDAALAEVQAAPSTWDVVLFAVHPGWFPDPVTYLSSWGAGAIDYNHATSTTINGSQWDLVQQTILKYPAKTAAGDQVVGVPTDASLRQRVYGAAKGKERSAIEIAAGRHIRWEAIVSRLQAIQNAGVPAVIPAGDWPGKTSCAPNCAAGLQRIYGLAARSELITVGATYREGSTDRLSPVSARGPTMDQALKPDLVAPSDLLGLVPIGSTLAGLPAAPTGLNPSWRPAGAGTGLDGRLILQAWSLVAAAVTTAQLGRLIIDDWPGPAATHAAGVPSNDARVLRGYLWAKSSLSQAQGSPGDGSRTAFPWEQGAGILPLTPLTDGPAPGSVPPIPLSAFAVGRVPFGQSRSKQVTLWAGGALPTTATTQLSRFFGAMPNGLHQVADFSDSSLTTSAAAGVVTIGASAGQYQGGLYTGIVTLAGYDFPAWAERTLTVKYRALFPFDDSEFENSVSFILLPGTPPNISPVGDALKALPPGLGDVSVRWGVTIDEDPWYATITDVTPGFYRIYLLEDHGMTVNQSDQAGEGVAPSLTGGAVSGVLVSSMPFCDDVTGTILGPLSLDDESCATQEAYIESYGSQGAHFDPDDPSGMCAHVAVAAGQNITIPVYCGAATMRGAATISTRAIHLPTAGEITTCGANLSAPGSSAIDTLVQTIQSGACATAVTTNTQPSGWKWKAHADSCGSADSNVLPNNAASDSFAGTYEGSVPLSEGTAVSALPVSTASYEFSLARPNVATDLEVTFGYHLENAQLLVVATSGDVTPTSASAALVASDPRIQVDNTLDVKGQTGTVAWHAGLLSNGAYSGKLIFAVIPTTWVATALAKAKVEICNVGIRVKTFAKDWMRDPVTQGTAQVQALQGKVTVGGHDLLNETSPANTFCRDRKYWNTSSHAFSTLGSECEETWAGFDVPKDDNTTAHHATSSGIATRFSDLRSGSLTGPSLATALAGASVYDPIRKIREFGCTDQSAGDPICVARENSNWLIPFPNIKTNGRFYTTLPVSDAMLRSTITTSGATRGSVLPVVTRGAGAPALPYLRCEDPPDPTECVYYDVQLIVVDGVKVPAAGELGYVPNPQVGRFYTGEAHPELNGFSTDLSAGTVSITQDGSGSVSILTITLTRPDGVQHTITTDLDCITINGGTPVCRP